MTGYAVIDIETTGFSPQHHDRIVEIGIVHVAPDGDIGDHWGTLVNPQRDIGATHIHGITAADVFVAPTFAQIVAHLLYLITGRALVAHNARFDIAFLEHEFNRAGTPVAPDTPALCTMEWSSRFLNGASRKLTDCCAAAGIKHTAAHSAIADARATAGLLAYYIHTAGNRPPWARTLAATATYPWPTVTGEPHHVTPVHRSETVERPDAWLDKITSKMPRLDNPAVESYVDVLERALLDGHLSKHEKNDLTTIAVTVGLHRDQLDKIHHTYLAALATAAWDDGIVTLEERLQLSQVGAALGIPNHIAEQILHDTEAAKPQFDVPTLHLLSGDQVAFTGQLTIPRDEWVARIETLGLEHGPVTKGTRAVVAADPDTLSGKATKARDCGIPIITETAFETIVTAMEHRLQARDQTLAD